MNKFTLPNLSYPYEALESWIDRKTMQIHHTKHHQGYVNKLNEALEAQGISNYPTEMSDFLRKVGTYDNSQIRNNLGGHANHSLFWTILSPQGGGNPSGKLAKAIESTFGSIDAFRKAFTTQALTQFGSGWAWLAVKPDGTLFVTQTPNQDNPLMDLLSKEKQGIPILGLDVWEHAYYLHYQNQRAAYVDAFWQVVDWESVSRHYMKALG